MPKIFISYRRSDAREEAVRIADAAADEFGAGAVFFDTDTMVPGDAFPAEIEANIGTSTAMLVVIGPDWMARDAATGLSRIETPDDWVRREIRLGLSQNKTVIPVLVQNAEMPERTELPLDIRTLADQNAISLPPDSFKTTLSSLLDRLRDRSAWLAAGTVFLTAAVAGFLHFFVEQTQEILTFLLNSAKTSAAEIERLSTIASPTAEMFELAELGFRAERMMMETIAGEVARKVIAAVNFAVYLALIAYGALHAARGYTGIDRDRITMAVFAGASLYVAVSFLLRGANLILPMSPTLFWPVWYGATFSSFCAAVVLVLRRRLRARSVDIVAVTLCAFAGTMIVQYLVFYLSFPHQVVHDFYISLLGDDIASTIAPRWSEWTSQEKVWIATIFESSPICLVSELGPGAKTCGEMDLTLSYAFRFIVTLGLACFVPWWRVSILCVALLAPILLILSILIVNALAIFELAVLETTLVLSDPGIPEALVLGIIAYALARWPITRRRVEQGTTDPK
jgi:hypothetical protein